MEGISGGSIGQNFRKDIGPALLGMSLTFQDENTSPFADNKAITFRIEGARRQFWGIIPGRNRLEGIKSGNADRVDIDSLPPARAASAPPRRMSSQATPIASELLEQAEVVHRFSPLMPSVIDICAAAMSDIIMGARKGLTRLAPLSRNILVCSNRVVRPPIPLPTMTAMLLWLAELIWSPAFWTAC